MDVSGLCSYADFIIICHGRSSRQVQAIAENLQVRIKHEKGLLPLGIEGMSDGKWVLVDYGEIVAHIFLEPVREYFGLEQLWPDARRIPVE